MEYSDEQIRAICWTVFAVAAVFFVTAAIVITNWVWYGECRRCRSRKDGT